MPLQLWRRDSAGAFERLYFGTSPLFSEVLQAWVIAEGRTLFIANDREGKQRWLNEAGLHQADAERARADAERARADGDRERSAREALECELEALKARVKRGPE